MPEAAAGVTDANGARFFLLRGAADFAAAEPDAPVWDPVAEVLRMPHRDQPRMADAGRAAALAAWRATGPLAEDGFGQLARLSADGQGVEVALSWPVAETQPLTARAETGQAADIGALLLDPVSPPEGMRFRDLAVGGTRLAVLFDDTAAPGAGDPEPAATRAGVVVVDLERRWQRTVMLTAVARRVWVDGAGRVWAAGDSDLMLVDGQPLPQPYVPRPDRFEPVEIEPDPPRELWRRLIPDGWTLLALASDADRLHALMWRETPDTGEGPGAMQAIMSRSLDPSPEHPWQIADVVAGLPFAIDLRAVARDALVLMLPREPADEAFRRSDLPVVELRAADPAAGTLASTVLQPRRWPQPAQEAARFVSDAGHRPRILTPLGPRGLYPLAQARHAAEAVATLEPLDTGMPGADWHRVYLDACVPLGTSVEIAARAYDGDEAEGPFIPQPAPVWVPLASELGFDGGRVGSEPGREGLFEVQLQRDDGVNRRLAGRRLQLRLIFRGDGRHSPAVAAMRVYHPRNSWAEQFLPAHLRQAEPAGAGTGPANGADFRDRLLASLEGMLTPVENRIAAAECWLSPETAPSDHLDRLAAMLGAQVPAHWPEARRRAWISATPELQRKRGTFAGLCLALDLATDGAVTAGHVVPVETYRLRRTAATILGLDLDDADHPLTLGTQLSGNSIVGPSLILSDETGRDFLALFAPELVDDLKKRNPWRAKAERKTVEAFFDRHAHRVDIVLHGPARQARGVVEEIIAEQVPAGVQHRIIETDRPFVLGLSPLLGIDTLLEHSPAWRRVMLDDTYLGREGVLRSPAAFAPEAAGYAESLAALMARMAPDPSTTGPAEGDAR